MPGYEWDGGDLLLLLHVQPRASRDEWAGEHDDALKLRVTAAPTAGKANRHIERWLAGAFGVGRGDITLVAGATARRKRFRVRSPKTLPEFIVRK